MEPGTDFPQLMTPSEVALLFKVSRGAVWGWVKDGVLEAVKIGPPGGKGTVRFRRADVEALLNRERAS